MPDPASRNPSTRPDNRSGQVDSTPRRSPQYPVSSGACAPSGGTIGRFPFSSAAPRVARHRPSPETKVTVHLSPYLEQSAHPLDHVLHLVEGPVTDLGGDPTFVADIYKGLV